MQNRIKQSMYNCKFCGAIMEFKMKSERDGRKTRFGKHKDGNCAKYIARKLSQHRQQSTWQRFTSAKKCYTCGGEYFYWLENKNGKTVCFDVLGPPWPKHGCDEHQEKHSEPSYQWIIEGYEPCVIEEVESRFICDHKLVVHIRGLKSGRKLALNPDRASIISFISYLHQPFHFRFKDLELNTYRLSGTSYVPQSYKWPKATGSFQPPL
jgi:hypothetical protein